MAATSDIETESGKQIYPQAFTVVRLRPRLFAYARLPFQ